MYSFNAILITIFLSIGLSTSYGQQPIQQDIVDIQAAWIAEREDNWEIHVTYRINGSEWKTQTSNGKNKTPYIKLDGTTVEIIRDFEWVFEEVQWIWQCEPSTIIRIN